MFRRSDDMGPEPDGAFVPSLRDRPAHTIHPIDHGHHGGGPLHNVATSGFAGFMSASDKTTLDSLQSAGMNFIIGDGQTAIGTGIKGDFQATRSGTLTSVTMLADAVGSIVVDVWRDTYANFPPTVADTITAAAKPTITAAVKSQDLVLTGWSTAVTVGDIFRFNVDSVSTIKRVVLIFTLTPS